MKTFDHRFAEPIGQRRAASNLPATTAASAPMTLAAPADLPGFGNGFVLRDVVTTAFYRWRLVLLMLLVPLLAAVALAFATPVRHTAEGLMVVTLSRESAGTTDISGFGPSILSIDTPKAVQSELEIVASDAVAQAALRRIGPATLYPEVAKRRWFGLLPAIPADEQLERASELMRRDLRADVMTNTNIVRVQFTYRDRRLAISALGALLNAYMDRRRAIFTDTSSSVLTTEVTRYADELRSIEAEISRIKALYGILDVEQNVRLAAARLDTIRQREDALREQREAALAQLASAKSRLDSQPERVFASSEVTNQTPNDDSRNTLLRLQQEREHVAAQYAPGYPALVELDAKIAAAKDAVRQNARSNFYTNRQTRNPTVDLLTSRVAQSQVEADSLERQLAEIERQRKSAEGYNAGLLGAETRLRDLARRRDALEAVYRQFATREAGAKLNSEARQSRGAAVHLVQQPTAPISGRSMTLSFLLAGLVAGALFAAAAAVLLTWLRRTFVTPAEAERSLFLPALASFPKLGKPFALDRADPAVADLAALLLDMGADGGAAGRMQLVQFVATDDADQRGQLARAVAVELAGAHDRRTLLVDLNGDGRTQLAELGAQPIPTHQPEDGMVAFGTSVPKLWASLGAQHSALANPHALQLQTERLLAELRQEFDVVLVVGPATIGTYAQRRLTVLVDANVVVVRAERTEAPQARQLRDSILSSGGNLLGLVFTGQRRVVPRAVEHMLP